MFSVAQFHQPYCSFFSQLVSTEFLFFLNSIWYPDKAVSMLTTLYNVSPFVLKIFVGPEIINIKPTQIGFMLRLFPVDELYISGFKSMINPAFFNSRTLGLKKELPNHIKLCRIELVMDLIYNPA